MHKDRIIRERNYFNKYLLVQHNNISKRFRDMSLEALVDDAFFQIVAQLLDEEDPALVSVSNRYQYPKQLQYSRFWPPAEHVEERDGQGNLMHNTPINYFLESNENMANEPEYTSRGIKRDSFGYHSVVQLRSVSKSVKQRIDKLPFISIRSELAQFYQNNIAAKEDRDFIVTGIKSEIHIAELQQKWSRMLDDYLQRSTASDNDKKTIKNNFMTLYNRAKFIYNERCEDHNGKTYCKASLLELEFTDVNNEPSLIQVKLVHGWDEREGNWYTQIFIYALNKDRPVEVKLTKPTVWPTPKNCMVQLLKDRGWLDLIYYNTDLTKTVCKELSLDHAFWAGDKTCLLIEFLLLVAGESKFIHFVPIITNREESDVESSEAKSYDWQMEFELDRAPKNGNKSYLTTVNEFKNKFLLNKIPSGKQGQRYLLNAKIQLGVSDVECSLKTSTEPIAQYIESISHCYDIEIAPGELSHLNSFYMKALMKSPNGGSFLLWVVEKIGHGYHSPCDYITLQVMPMNAISARSLGLNLYEQGVVYYHFMAQSVVVNEELSQKLIEHLTSAALIKEENKTTDSATSSRTPKKKFNVERMVASGPQPMTFLTLFDALLAVRFSVLRRFGAFHKVETSYYEYGGVGFSHTPVCTDWKLEKPRLW